jgi:hypothetical protein
VNVTQIRKLFEYAKYDEGIINPNFLRHGRITDLTFNSPRNAETSLDVTKVAPSKVESESRDEKPLQKNPESHSKKPQKKPIELKMKGKRKIDQSKAQISSPAADIKSSIEKSPDNMPLVSPIPDTLELADDTEIGNSVLETRQYEVLDDLKRVEIFFPQIVPFDKSKIIRPTLILYTNPSIKYYLKVSEVHVSMRGKSYQTINIYNQ